jgi:hypothetical protein
MTTTNDTTTKTIAITSALRKQINEAVRKHVGGFAPFAEVGLRQMNNEPWQPNALNWDDESDLGELKPLRDLKVVDVFADAPNCVELDLYVTTTRDGSRELETNVCILIRDGAVVGATSSSNKVAAIKASLSFPTGRGF